MNAPRPEDLPGRVVVGVNGAYWRDYGDGYSMCPVSEDNDPVEVVATYVRAEDAKALRELLREAIEAVHQTGSIRSHADPNDKTGWNVHGIETCEDLLCVEALAALEPQP